MLQDEHPSLAIRFNSDLNLEITKLQEKLAEVEQISSQLEKLTSERKGKVEARGFT